MALMIQSPAFADGGSIPREHTCEGAGSSPPLRWSGAPEATKSFVLIVDDPDAPDPRAPKRTWVHWVVYNLPAATRSLAAGAAGRGLPPGTLQGLNDWGQPTYGGPCPPVGRHRYVHTLYALDTLLEGLRRPTKSSVLGATKGHVLGQARLVGTYQMGG